MKGWLFLKFAPNEYHLRRTMGSFIFNWYSVLFLISWYRHWCYNLRKERPQRTFFCLFTFCFSPKVMLVIFLSFLEKCKQETLLFFLQGKVILKCLSSTHSSLFHPNAVLTAPVQDKIKLTLLLNIPLIEIHGSFLCLHVGKDYVAELWRVFKYTRYDNVL